MHTRFYLSPRPDTTFHNESPVNLLSPFTNAISFSLFLIFLLPSFLFSTTPVANSWHRLMKVFRAFWKRRRNMHNPGRNCISFNRIDDEKIYKQCVKWGRNEEFWIDLLYKIVWGRRRFSSERMQSPFSSQDFGVKWKLKNNALQHLL